MWNWDYTGGQVNQQGMCEYTMKGADGDSDLVNGFD